ncbi:histidine kinase [Rossellomorea vietnamensis]|uniref:Histidine kinase n=1 Tax=Rossellomorea vietnamensis TaxID=218284 RepID=A0A5D4KH59_9BACI|nr:histidine kinase [Rossellomorea vietnamensis]TYR76634.1 histidine kinase [Rossellomorea vietnamensis]
MKKRLAVAISVSILVFILALWFLSSNYSEIEQLTRILIALGGTILSGVITYFLFPENERKI